jgi:ATP-dependent exoDNAse (exonuclease V) alpha subunit
VVGHTAVISAGEWITATGEWLNDRTYGQQFKAEFLKTSAPTSVEGIERYLASGMIRGIGPVYAKKLLRAFGDKVFVLVIAGCPGAGKTTIVDSILRILTAKGVSIQLCAPTGRAAKRMSEATGLEAKTIHRLLEVDPKGGGFRRDAGNPLDCDLIVVDETSMVDVVLMYALLKAVPERSALLVVGDVDQLPSVGPGQVLADVITSGAIPVVRLSEVFRQAAKSRSF